MFNTIFFHPTSIFLFHPSRHNTSRCPAQPVHRLLTVMILIFEAPLACHRPTHVWIIEIFTGSVVQHRFQTGPLRLDPTRSHHSYDVWETVIEAAIKQRFNYGVDYETVVPCQRWIDGQSPTAADDTIYIKTPSGPDRGRWFSFMKCVVGTALNVGFKGRIEMVYNKAAGGLRSYPPRYTEYHRHHWGEIERVVLKHLTDANIPWDIIMPANRGHWTSQN